MRVGEVGTQRQAGRLRQRLARLSARRRRLMLWWILALAFLAVIPPVFLHFRLRRLSAKRSRQCAWLDDPPLVCAHGGDAGKAAPNTMAAYHAAIRAKVDCMEIDVSRSYDGALFALHDRYVSCSPSTSDSHTTGRDLQRMTENDSTKVGDWRKDELKRLDAGREEVITIEDALSLMVSNAVRRIVLDAKVGPPFYEKGLAADILAVVQKTKCMNCIIWAKSDTLVREFLKQSQDFQIGYIVMRDPSTGERSELLRMNGAEVVGVYHPLIEEKMMRTLHGRGKKVYAWTVDDEPAMRRMLSEGLDAVITSRPTVLQQVMRRMSAECHREYPLFW